MTDSAQILIADDQPHIVDALRMLLQSEGYVVESASSPKQVLQLVQRTEFDAALIDLNYTRDTTSGREGLDLLATVHAYDSTLPVIVMTAWASVELAVEAMRSGARDFVQKPWDNSRLISIVRTQVDLSRALRRTKRLEAENRALRETGRPVMIAQSPAMRPVIEMIERVGPSSANVLITGENGTGKGVVARALHAVSPRSQRAMVAVNIGGLSEGVFESELFGHVRGAFTDAKVDRVGRFEMADGGTLFLDEIGNISATQQSKLLRVLETGEFERVGSSQTKRADVRVISATNASLKEEVDRGAFRQDLLFRLNTIEIHIPPLRDREDDIPLLAYHFLEQHARRYRKRIDRIDDAAMKALGAHSWPGNVRELDHTIERAVLMTTAPTIRSSDLGLRESSDGSIKLEELSLEEVEALLIKKALARANGNVRAVAETLGLSRSALYRRIQRYGL